MTYSLFHLFLVFLYVGTFTIGGGLMAITLMQQALVGNVLTADEFFNMVAISEGTPGPIGINIATYVGFSQYGVIGALVTTAGEVLPSIICITIVSRFFMKFHDRPLVKAAFYTLRPATTGMILVAALEVFFVALIDTGGASRAEAFSSAAGSIGSLASLIVWKGVVFYILATVALFRTKIHPVLLIALGAVFGAVFL